MGKAFIALKKYKECLELLATQNDPDLQALAKEANQLKEKEENAMKQMEEKQAQVGNKIEEYFKEMKWRLVKKNEQLP